MSRRIVVLGAGYAGLTAAHRLRRLLRPDEAEILLVNRMDRFVERVRLHQVAAGQQIRQPQIEGIELVVGEVIALDPEKGMVNLVGRDIGFDQLVYGLGSHGDLDVVPGGHEYALPVGSLAGAEGIRGRLRELYAGQVVVVVGGGLTGIETAAELAEARQDLSVILVSAQPVGGWLHPRARRRVCQGLQGLGVEVHEGVAVAAIDGGGVIDHHGQEITADLVVWAAGFAVPPIAARAGLAVDERGRIRVDGQLRSLSHPEITAVGDAAAASAGGGTTRMSCQTGLPMGSYAGVAIARSLRGHGSRPAKIRYVWQNISLGRGDGVTQFTRSDDSPRPLVLSGLASARFKELITRSAAWMALR